MEYISPSRMSLYNQCPLAYDLKYLKTVGIGDETVDWYADYGTLNHSIYEGIAKKEIVLLEQAFRKFDSDFPSCKVPERNRSDYYKQGREAIERKWNELNRLNIVGAEVEFTVPIDFTIPPLHGFIDLVYRDEKGRLIVRDYKTSKPYTKSILNKQYQPYFYSIACKALFGEYPFKFEFDFVRFNEFRDFIVTEKFVKLGEIKIRGTWNKMKSGQYPAIYNPFFCSNFCENRSICPIFQRKNGF
ncbi:hypothetical protein CHCC14600_0217 [Bacillus licheniformis]|uniref:RecB family exonuclease n=1 Tax=Bacillus TaxID=1386 RepID=UPI0009C0FEDE|nr:MULTISPECIES: PD-(D/E)XK nuclease family protein [Bacillus]ARW41728.1 hypothetical protein S100141_00405 [Bacillus licheniformis]MCA1182490.1 PD-(D/E)XK nuclease family protein [Bacillus licheniformis]MEC0475000.1 PD-(D/E)XK nuclease family protein [Bacillus licheniformis]MEC3606326.1 PD-(D/E)XK nuclease family protein [Bacillus glycinifermentans]PRS16410.1 PD-(D/E)XK nuclease family protein [Bacillus paralicheniformis]